MSQVQSEDFSTLTTEHKYFTDLKQIEPLTKYITTVFMCLFGIQSLNVTTGKVTHFNLTFPSIYVRIIFFGCVPVYGGLVIESGCVIRFSCGLMLEDQAELVLSHQAARTGLRQC